MNLRKKLLTFLWTTTPSGAKWLTEVECLTNNFSVEDGYRPYIDTGVEASWDVPFEIVATITKTSENRCILTGNYSNQLTFYVEITATNRIRFGSQSSTDADPTFVAFDIYTNSSYPIPMNVPTKVWVKYNPRHDVAHTVDYEVGLEALDGSVSTKETGSVYRAGQPVSARRNLRIFCDYRTAISTFDGGFKIHQCEIKMGNQYRKYIPCLDFYGVPCMYEKSTGTLAYNDGTGEFIAGRTIAEVDWMHLTGTQYFNTGLKPNTLTTTLKTKYTFEGTAMMMGCRNTTNYYDMCSIYMPAATTARPYSRIRLDWMVGSGSIYSSNLESEVIELEITGNYAKVNGVEYTSDTKTSVDMLSPFYIGCAYTSNTSTHYTYAQIGKEYYIHLYDPNKGERYCVPAHDENNVGFFFDRVNHFIIDNEGTNTDNLTWGDDIHYVGYLESTGPQWIDTGIQMKSNYGVEIEAKQTSTTTGVGRYLFGDAPASKNFLLLVTSGGNQYRLSIDSLNKDSGVSGYDGKYHVHKVENKTYFVDGESKGSLAATDFTCNRNARLFSVATTQTLLDNTWQIKQGKIIDENGNVLTNFVPVIKGNDDTPAMFDLVSRTFATNQATGDDFICGNSILGIPEETGLPIGFVPLQYLRGEAGPYIDTGIKMSDDYGVEIVVRNTDETTGKSRYLFGSGTTTNRYMLAIGSGTDRYLFDLETSAYRLNTSFNAYDGQFHTHKIENKTYYIDGVSQGTSTSTGTFTTSQNAFLFGAAGIARTNSYWDIKSEKIFNGNGVLLQHLIPALRTVDGVAGMFDLVSGEFLPNAGIGEFDYAYGNTLMLTPYSVLKSSAKGKIESSTVVSGKLAYLDGLTSNAEETGNKTTTINSSSTDTEYPSAKAVYDLINN